MSLASFDILALAGSVGTVGDGLTHGEFHALDYLACLMAIYDGRSPAWWGFGFSVTDSGAPFSRVLSDTIARLTASGWVVRDDRVHRLSPTGKDELDFENTLAVNVQRFRYLSAASSSALSMPLPAISDALSHEPGLRRALSYIRRKRLLDETSLTLIAEQFRALTDGLKQSPQDRVDLTVPAIVWLTYLSRSALSTERRAA